MQVQYIGHIVVCEIFSSWTDKKYKIEVDVVEVA